MTPVALLLLYAVAAKLVLLENTISGTGNYEQHCYNKNYLPAHLHDLKNRHINNLIYQQARRLRVENTAWVSSFQRHFREFPMYLTSQRDGVMKLTVLLDRRVGYDDMKMCVCYVQRGEPNDQPPPSSITTISRSMDILNNSWTNLRINPSPSPMTHDSPSPNPLAQSSLIQREPSLFSLSSSSGNSAQVPSLTSNSTFGMPGFLSNSAINSAPSPKKCDDNEDESDEEDEDFKKAVAESLKHSNQPPPPILSVSRTISTTFPLQSPPPVVNNSQNTSESDVYNLREEEEKIFFSFNSAEFSGNQWLDVLTKPGVGCLKRTFKSLAYGLLWYFRARLLDRSSVASFNPKIIDLDLRLTNFTEELSRLPNLRILDPKDEQLAKMDRFFGSVRQYVTSKAPRMSWETVKTLHYLWKHAMLTVDKKIGYFALIVSLELRDELRLNSLRWFSIYEGPTHPKLSEGEWRKLLSMVSPQMPPNFARKLRRMIGAHGPKSLRNEILGMDLKNDVLEPLNLPNFVTSSIIDIPMVDLAHADRPEFQPRDGTFKMTNNYKEFINALGRYILTGERSETLSVRVYRMVDVQRQYVHFADFGGPRRAFMTAFGMLFRVHEYLMTESVKGSMCIHPMATEEVYAYFANMLGLLGINNYNNAVTLKVSIGYFLSPEYAEYLFDPNMDRIPTVEEIKRFFPGIEKDFALMAQSPEDFGSYFDSRHSVGFTHVVNQFNVSNLGAGKEPKNEAELRVLMEEYVEKAQMNLYHGHAIFVRNLQTFFHGQYDYENLDLLIARRGDLEAEEVFSVLTFQGCDNYMVRYEDQGGRMVPLPQAMRRMVQEMTAEERANLFMYGTGAVPPILTSGCLRVFCAGSSVHSWSASSCSGTIYPPNLNNAPFQARNFSVLFDALKMQCAMDQGSTGGNENTI